MATRTPGLAGAKGMAREVGSQLPDYLAVRGERREKEQREEEERGGKRQEKKKHKTTQEETSRS